MEKKLQKIYLTDYNLLIAQDLWQAHYQILSTIFLKKFTKLDMNMDATITCGIKYKYRDYFLEYTDLEDDLTK